jgi:hypothetical protein
MQLSPKHTAELLKIGVHLKKGGALTQQQIETVANAYPSIPFEVIWQRAQHINSLPPEQRVDRFAFEVSSGDPADMAQARGLLDSFSTHYEREVQADQTRDMASAISGKLNAQAKTAPVPADKPLYQKSETRQILEKQMNGGKPREINIDRVADRAEKALGVLEKPAEHSVRDTLSAAFDTAVISDAVDSGALEDQRDAA